MLIKTLLQGFSLILMFQHKAKPETPKVPRLRPTPFAWVLCFCGVLYNQNQEVR